MSNAVTSSSSTSTSSSSTLTFSPSKSSSSSSSMSSGSSTSTFNFSAQRMSLQDQLHQVCAQLGITYGGKSLVALADEAYLMCLGDVTATSNLQVKIETLYNTIFGSCMS
jgi:hypothetical protein